VGWRIADAYLAIAALLVVELVVVGVVARRELAGAYELTRALRNLLPIAVAAAAPVAIAGGVLVEIVRRATRPAARVTLAVLAAMYGGGVAYGVSAGRLFAGGRRPGFVAIVALAALVGAFFIGPVLARALAGSRTTSSKRASLFAAIGVILLGVEVANAIVLPRLYPAFHLGLAGLALLIAPFVSLALPTTAAQRASEGDAPEPRASRPSRVSGSLVRAVGALLVFTIAAALAPSAARRLSHLDNIRLIYLAHAPLLGHAVEIGALLSPPDPLDADGALPEARAGGASVDLRGRDLVLITIDALRADHAGAYGYSRPTTPNLDRLAEQGLVFEAAYTPTPHTSYAVSSLMTGKYMRPLVLQGLGADSETWAQHLRRYGYRTAAFYPPAVFFIDEERLAAMRDRRLDFEYSKVQFSTAAARAEEVRGYLKTLPPPASGDGREGREGSQGLFLWVHLFEPHEPYEAHEAHPFGDRDIDRYDAEIAAADAGMGAIIEAVRAARPGAVIIVTADHGEEFLEHGGRYHGTTVYEEQVRVPLVISAPGLIAPGRVAAPVQLVDLLPTVLAGLDIPRPARVRGTDLGPYLAGAGRAAAAGSAEPASPAGPTKTKAKDLSGDESLQRGLAFSETDAHTLLARGSLRLLCARKIGACALYDVARDPGQTADLSAMRPADLAEMRTELRALEASHGRFEVRGLRTEGKGWPDALRRGMAGDGDAATDVAALLDDADVVIRRKAAEILFELKRPEIAASLRLALLRDEDDEVRRWSALALTRLGEGAPRTRELLEDRDIAWRRLAALALAEAGDDRGEAILIAWWREAFDRKENKNTKGAERRVLPFERAREIAAALAHIRSKDAVPALLEGLDDVRLRPHLAEALAAIGSDAARPALAKQLAGERYQTARIAIAEALMKLGAGPELRDPLVWLLGTPDPLPGGVGIALAADLLEHVGGPRASALTKLRRFARSGVAVAMVVPKPVTPKGAPPSVAASPPGIRVLCRARSLDGRRGEVRVGLRARPGWAPDSTSQSSLVPADAPELDPARSTVLEVAPGKDPTEPFATFPKTVGVRPGDHREFVVYATQNVEVLACVVVPLSEELPPPPPEPWSPPSDEAQPH
jgi:arylsulfatase A-like enzyme